MSTEQDEYVLVTIKSVKLIPFLNRRGPVNSPISILKVTYLTLKAMGFEITVHEKKNVSVDRTTGKRVVTEENFVAVQEGEYVEVETTEPSPALVPSPVNEAAVVEPEQVSAVQQPEPVEGEEDVDASDEESTDEDVEEADEESEVPEGDVDADGTEVDVYDLEVYKTWTKAQLLTYLRKLEEHLSPEIVQELASANKNRLLEIIEAEVISAAE